MAETGWLKKALAEAKAEREAAQAFRKDRADRRTKLSMESEQTQPSTSDSATESSKA